MDTNKIQAYLHEHIPLSLAMCVQVVSVTEEQVVLSAPLEPNINHRETVFGGSASALAIFSAWTLINFRLQSEGIDSRLVIQRNAIEYTKPIVESFLAVSVIENTEVWEKFVKILHRKRRSRISVISSLVCKGEKVGELQGDFVAICTEKT